jgi:hypothetical protein
MKIAVLHSPDALEPPVDPVLDQVGAALASARHVSERVAADPEVERLVTSLRGVKAALIFNLAESFGGTDTADPLGGAYFIEAMTEVYGSRRKTSWRFPLRSISVFIPAMRYV